MKRYLFTLILLFFSVFVFGQKYDKEWEKIIEYEKTGSYKSAFDEVEGIYKKAKQKNDEVEIIKSLFFRAKYMQHVEEDAQSKVIAVFQSEIESLKEPTNSLLEYAYVVMINDHLNANRYKISQRTSTEETLNTDFQTWTLLDFDREIDTYIHKAISNQNKLKNQPLIKYEGVLGYQNIEDIKSKSLYDFLHQEYIEIYRKKVTTSDLISFHSETNNYFLENFTNFPEDKLDTLPESNTKKLLQLYQHRELDQPKNDCFKLERILGLFDYYNQDKTAYLQTLDDFQKSVQDTTVYKNIQLYKANTYASLASKDNYPDYNNKALAIIDSLTKEESRENTYKSAILLKDKILSKKVMVRVLNQVYEKENTRAHVEYKNTDSLYVSYYKIAADFLFENNTRKRDSLVTQIIENQNPIKVSRYKLPETKGYFNYSTEVLLPKMEKGTYLMVYDVDATTNLETEKVNYTFVNVSDLAVQHKKVDNTEFIYVLHRKTGKPIPNATILQEKNTFTTNKQGLASIKNKKGDRYKRQNILVIKDNDTLHTSFYKSSYYTKSKIKEEEEYFDSKVEFFMDRAIYRPGQMAYVKGIVFQNKNKTISTVPHLTVAIEVYDRNYSTIKEFEIQTNEYGSFNFEFEIPRNGVTGTYYIDVDEPDNIENDKLYYKKRWDEHLFWDYSDLDNRISFRVEEYKRPTFKAEFDPVTEDFVVNQEVNVTGKAVSYSGVNLNNSKVVYRVERNSYPNYWSIFYPSETKTITEGETTTDANGNFTIDFKAIPNPAMDKKNLPLFYYNVYADVTDARGETQSTKTTVKVGYHGLQLTASLPNIVNTESKPAVKLHSTNLNDEFFATKATVSIYFQSSLNTQVKNRVFPNPEIPGFTEEEFASLFPYEKNTKKTDALGDLIFTKEIHTESDKELALEFLKKEKAGNYKLIFSAIDSHGNEIESKKDFQLIQNQKDLSDKLYSIKQVNAEPFKDGYVDLEISSPIQDLFVTIADTETPTFFLEQVTLEKGNKKIRLPIHAKNDQRIQFYVNSYFENENFPQSYMVENIKDSDLEIETITWRNKLKPGSEETWSFKISNDNKAIQAEVLASMYDSSLDQFATKNWNSLYLYSYNWFTYSSISNLSNNNAFTYLNGINPPTPQFSFTNNNVLLYWFGFNFNNPSPINYHISQKALSINPDKIGNVSGTVTDEDGIPLLGVTITIKNTIRGTTTDFDGYYSISAGLGEELEFNHIGYETQSRKIDRSFMDVVLKEDSSIDEVVVVGYAAPRAKQQATGAVTEMLSGQVAGVQIADDMEEDSISEYNVLGASSIKETNQLVVIDGVPYSAEDLQNLDLNSIASATQLNAAEGTKIYGSKAANGVLILTTKETLEELQQIQTRTNFKETAFFYPDLRTDKKGNIEFSFTTPEALTEWKLRLFAHNKNAESGYLEKLSVTQKDLMIAPNMPRFFREKDSIKITARVSNLTVEKKSGLAMLQLFDAMNMQSIDVQSANEINHQEFEVDANGNTTVSWKIYVPEGVQGIHYKVLAKAGNFTDGEENLIPVLTNNILVTESIPIWVREKSKKDFTFDLLENNTSSTLKNHQLTLEYTSNPTWLAIQSLPYLIEYEHDCSEQVFSRYYANTMAADILNSNPEIAQYFKDNTPDDFADMLEENQELKSILMEETPWFIDTKSEEEKTARLALLFDLQRLSEEQQANLELLKNIQSSSGGFPWFEGGTENEFITRHIVAGFGKLDKRNDIYKEEYNHMMARALDFLDKQFVEHNEEREKRKQTNWNPSIAELHYIYARSFYLESNPLSEKTKKYIDKNLELLKKDWLSPSLYQKGMLAIVFQRFGDKEMAKKITHHLKESSSNNEEWGMYWVNNESGWNWYQAPIETQALLIEAFDEVENDKKSIDKMKVWLLKNKQVSHWSSTKATFEAIDALLRYGKDWVDIKDRTTIKLGDSKLLNQKLTETEKQTETGYVKVSFTEEEIQKDMAKLSIDNKNDVPGFGGFYWQYFEDLDKIEGRENQPLQVSKKLYLKKNTADGQELQEITDENPLRIGDIVTVRLIVSAKEDMEFVHLKDMRASGLEPIEVLSKYHFRDDLIYYMSTRDAATHFFFDKINKGTYVLEYDMKTNNVGEFSNGITTIQSMYAPEYSSHSEGIRIQIKED